MIFVMVKLSVNINKAATLRNSRGGNNPNIVQFALDCEKYGADGNPFLAEPEVSIENWEGIITRSDKDWTMPPFSRGKGLIIVKWNGLVKQPNKLVICWNH